MFKLSFRTRPRGRTTACIPKLQLSESTFDCTYGNISVTAAVIPKKVLTSDQFLQRVIQGQQQTVDFKGGGTHYRVRRTRLSRLKSDNISYCGTITTSIYVQAGMASATPDSRVGRAEFKDSREIRIFHTGGRAKSFYEKAG